MYMKSKRISVEQDLGFEFYYFLFSTDINRTNDNDCLYDDVASRCFLQYNLLDTKKNEYMLSVPSFVFAFPAHRVTFKFHDEYNTMMMMKRMMTINKIKR